MEGKSMKIGWENKEEYRWGGGMEGNQDMVGKAILVGGMEGKSIKIGRGNRDGGGGD